MSLFYILVAWVLLQGTPYIRDIFNLPLHSSRTLVIDLLILLLAFFLLIFNETKKHRNNHDEKVNASSQLKTCFWAKREINSRNNLLNKNLFNNLLYFPGRFGDFFLRLCGFLTFSHTVLLWAIPGFFIYISSIINGSTELMYFKQYFVFLILTQFFFWVIKRGQLYSLVIGIRVGAVLFISVQVLFFILNIMYDGLYQDLTQKSSFSIAMLIMSELSRRLGWENLYKSFIFIGFVSAIIGSAKIFFLLFFLVMIVSKINLRGAIAMSISYIIMLLPVVVPYIISLMMDIQIDEVIERGNHRINIDDNVSSLVSRIYSVEYTIMQENFWTMFGNNESAASHAIFWGYPVHNLYIALIYSHGYLLLIIIILYKLAIWRFFQGNAGLGLILSFTVIYVNDILPLLSLFFIPYVISKNNQISRAVQSQKA
jgi:hypothetical protein